MIVKRVNQNISGASSDVVMWYDDDYYYLKISTSLIFPKFFRITLDKDLLKAGLYPEAIDAMFLELSTHSVYDDGTIIMMENVDSILMSGVNDLEAVAIGSDDANKNAFISGLKEIIESIKDVLYPPPPPPA